MFTKKLESTANLTKFGEKKSDSESPFAERPSTSVKSTSSSKMVPSIIGEDLSITGNVRSKGELQIDGEIQGDINCGSLLLGETSQVIGGLIAEDVVVRGRVVGSIRGLRVTLQSQAHVEGDIFHQSLAIEQGAYFEGKSRRSDDPMADLKTEKSQNHSRSDRPFESRSDDKDKPLNSAAE
ncbi:MAG: polymer-forming cytoskeletal protein [Alphaproteobacteria bacterium]|nr:polymer-forming cytoskeletal protein [Alphaproteobacteria bacterium]